MSDRAVAAQRQQQRQQGLIAGLVTLPFRFFGVLCGALLLCILIECVGMHFFWPDQGWRHAQGMPPRPARRSAISRRWCAMRKPTHAS